MLVARGVDEKSLTVPEAGPPGAAARSTSPTSRAYRDGGPNGVHAWLLYAAEAYAAGAEASPLRRPAEEPSSRPRQGRNGLRRGRTHCLKILSSGPDFKAL